MQSYEKLARIPIFKEDLGFLIEPPLTPPWEGGETTALPPSPSENDCFGMYHIGQNRYHDST